MSKTVLENLIRDLECKEEEIEFLKNKIRESRREGKFLCNICGQYHKIKNCSLFESLSYDPNTGSPNGGFYTRDNFYIQCLKNTNSYNRVYFRNTLKDYEHNMRRKKILQNLFLVYYKKSFLDGKTLDMAQMRTYYWSDNYWFDDKAEKLYGKKTLKSLGI